jgi:hypothetical protein
MKHTLEECPNISSEYQDTCQESVSLDFIIDRLTSVQVGGFWALVQVIIYALVIYLGLVIISKITDKRKRER